MSQHSWVGHILRVNVFFPFYFMWFVKIKIKQNVLLGGFPSSGVSSCGGPGGQSGRNNGCTRHTGKASPRCVSWNGASAHQNEQSTNHNLPRSTGRASHLQETKMKKIFLSKAKINCFFFYGNKCLSRVHDVHEIVSSHSDKQVLKVNKLTPRLVCEL